MCEQPCISGLHGLRCWLQSTVHVTLQGMSSQPTGHRCRDKGLSPNPPTPGSSGREPALAGSSLERQVPQCLGEVAKTHHAPKHRGPLQPPWHGGGPGPHQRGKIPLQAGGTQRISHSESLQVLGSSEPLTPREAHGQGWQRVRESETRA